MQGRGAWARLNVSKHLSKIQQTNMPFTTTGWKGDIDPFLERIAEVASGSSSLRIFNAHTRLAIGLPADRAAALAVVGLYHPQRWKGRLLKGLAELAAVSSSRLALSVFHKESRREPHVTWLRSAAKAGTVGFLGCNPAHGPRCILGGILPETGEKFVAKLGFDESAAAIEREAAFLNSVSAKYTGVIQPMEFDQDDNWKLLRLPYLGEEGPSRMDDPRVVGLLDAWVDEERVTLGELPWARSLLEKVPSSAVPNGWHVRMESHRIHRALTHGDFAVWNLRLVDGRICALDWEWADESGLAGIDLAHGLRQECYMVKMMSPKAAVKNMLGLARELPWIAYLARTGWTDHLDDWLSLGLLHSHFNARNDSTEMLRVLGIHLTIS
jgi:hypothetical protein